MLPASLASASCPPRTLRGTELALCFLFYCLPCTQARPSVPSWHGKGQQQLTHYLLNEDKRHLLNNYLFFATSARKGCLRQLSAVGLRRQSGNTQLWMTSQALAQAISSPRKFTACVHCSSASQYSRAAPSSDWNVTPKTLYTNPHFALLGQEFSERKELS